MTFTVEQLNAILQLCEEEGWSIVEIFNLHGTGVPKGTLSFHRQGRMFSITPDGTVQEGIPA